MERFAKSVEIWAVAVLGGIVAFYLAIPPTGSEWDPLRVIVATVGVVAVVAGIAAVIAILVGPRGKPEIGSGSISASTTGDQSHSFAITGNQATVNIGAQIGAEAIETARRTQLVSQLHADYWREYIAGHDGITPRQMAGVEPVPIGWLTRRLQDLGEPWNPLPYYRFAPVKAITPAAEGPANTTSAVPSHRGSQSPLFGNLLFDEAGFEVGILPDGKHAEFSPAIWFRNHGMTPLQFHAEVTEPSNGDVPPAPAVIPPGERRMVMWRPLVGILGGVVRANVRYSMTYGPLGGPVIGRIRGHIGLEGRQIVGQPIGQYQTIYSYLDEEVNEPI